MTFTELLNGLPAAILSAIIASIVGGLSYVFWRLFSLILSILTDILGGIITFLLLYWLLSSFTNDLKWGLILLLVLVIPYGLGSWFHLLSVRGTEDEGKIAFYSSAFLMVLATFSSLFFGLFAFTLVGDSNFDWPDVLYWACSFVSPSIAPLLIWCRRNMKLRAGYDTPLED